MISHDESLMSSIHFFPFLFLDSNSCSLANLKPQWSEDKLSIISPPTILLMYKTAEKSGILQIHKHKGKR